MTSLKFVLRLARRDARATRRRLALLTTAVIAGVAALVAINSFTENLRTSVAEQAQALLGADLSLRSRGALDTNTAAVALLDSLRQVGDGETRVARSTSFTAMAYLGRADQARLVQVRGVDPGWPFYGAIETSPEAIWDRLQAGETIVDPSLLSALGAEVGDTLALGEGRYPIAGTVVSVPGDIGLEAAFGARVYIATASVPGTNLLGFGARVDHETFLRLPPGIDPQEVAEANRSPLREARVRIRTVADDRDDLTEGLTRLGEFLGLVALAALLLGGLGTASAISVMIRQRLDAIAMLRCLGATSWQVVGIHLVQAAAMGLLGSVIGAALGVALQQVIPLVLADFLPVDVRVLPSPRAILLGIGLGVWTAAGFALLPLLAIRSISPLATLRRDTNPPAMRWDLPRLGAALALVGSVVGLAAVQVGSLRLGAWFAGAAAVALVVLWLTSQAIIRVARRAVPRGTPYLVRQGLANLHRPGNQTVTVVVALGFGAFLLATLFTAQVNLLREFRVDSDGSRANFVLFDIQSDQRATVDAALAAEGLVPVGYTPIVPMRLAAVDGQSVAEILAAGGRTVPDTLVGAEGGSLWAIRREYRSTYRGVQGGSERVTLGRWFDGSERGRGRNQADPVAISVEAGLAGELVVGVGDTLVWNIQGVRVHSVITSLREVNWARFEPNFFVVFAPGALEDAPQSWVTLTRVTDAAARGRIQRRLAEQVPNVTSVDLGEVQRALESVIGRVVTAIRFMALFSLATGAVVLVGAIATSRWQRIREGTLLRTLGATRGQVLRILGVEYATLGLAAALVAATLAGVAGWALARWLFETTFVLPVLPLLGLAAGLVALTTTVGLWSSLEVLERPPLEVLRAE